MAGARSVARRFAVSVIAALTVGALVYALRPRAPSVPARERVFETPGARFQFNPASGGLTLTSRDGANGFDVDLVLVVDGDPNSLPLSGPPLPNRTPTLHPSPHLV